MKPTALAVTTFLVAMSALAQLAGAGYALSFNGANSYVAIATTGSLTGTFTVELWVNPNDPTGSLSLVGSCSLSSFGFDSVMWRGTETHGEIGNGANWLATSANGYFPYTTGSWSHIAYVVTPTNFMTYGNGLLAGLGATSVYGDTNPVPLLYDSNHQLRISNGSPGEFMNGQIDEVRIWSTARSASDIQGNMHRTLTGSEPGLMGYWRFDEGTGTTVADASGHGFTGTLVNGPVWVVSTAPLGPPTPLRGD